MTGWASRHAELRVAQRYCMVIVRIVGGLLLGAIYALFSSGLTLIWGMMNFINFAHGEFVMLGMYVALLDRGLARRRSAGVRALPRPWRSFVARRRASICRSSAT